MHARAAGRRDDQGRPIRRAPGRSAGLTRARRAGGVAGRTARPPMAARPPTTSVKRLIKRSEGARPQGRALSLRDDGRARRQRPAESARRNRPAALSLARAHHLPSRAGQAGTPDGTQRSGDAGRSAGFDAATRRGFNRMIAALCAICGSEAGGVDGLHPGQRARRPHARALGLRRLSGGRAAAGAWRRRCGRSSAPARRSSMPPTGRNTARMFSTAAARCASPSIRFSPSPHIDAVGIDYYPPISDWRDGAEPCRPARRRAASTTSTTCAGACGSGEAFDWYYADACRRATRRRARRSPTAPMASHGSSGRRISSPVVQPHMERVDGVEIGAPTAWMPQSKPIWLTEIGMPAVDKGAERPERLSRSEILRIRLAAVLPRRRDDLAAGARAGGDPVALRPGPARPRGRQSGLATLWRAHGRSGASLRLGLGRTAVSRLPRLLDVWADGANWENGHWITGRIEGAALDRADRARSCRLRLRRSGLPALRPRRLRRRLCDRPADVGRAARSSRWPRLFGFDAVALGRRDRAGRAAAVRAIAN